MFTYFMTLIGQRWFILSLLLINIFGTIYGFIWYGPQLQETPWYFLPLVPNSPTASLFFCIVLAAFLFGRNMPLVEALAAVTLLKYGVWAVVMILWAGAAGSVITLLDFMLIFSHLGMAVQGLLYAPFYKIKPWHLIIVAVWTLHNDVIDYVYGMHPWVKSTIMPNIEEIAYFTFWLSIASLLIVYYLHHTSEKRELPNRK
ncbi:putative membrane protein YpjA [Salisediminibacterium halotolerans]|nr:DUF1405 domain-containing protein [Salisediminibacterium halotolerans]RLJ77924.1 putative membrane protein YpjA [Actinophytocola xinjiangensis]RPE88738.1 putative membrane protein YpjA [Salisediminibacterium halotolerans]TWG36901.1 putative membrane protein YpjA [Salisediminibacterium halotolerans]GEL07413.1 membrane protein [Salisediminibacterium halotolerans]